MKAEEIKISCRRQCQYLIGLLEGETKFTPVEVKDVADTVDNIKKLSSEYVIANLANQNVNHKG